MADPDGDYDPQVLVDEAAEASFGLRQFSLLSRADDGGKLKSAPIRDLRLRSGAAIACRRWAENSPAGSSVFRGGAGNCRPAGHSASGSRSDRYGDR